MKVGGNMYGLTQSADEQVRLRACQWWTARRMGWKETSVTEQTGKDGGPIETKDVSALDVIRARIPLEALQTATPPGIRVNPVDMLRKTKKVVPWTAYLHIDSQPMSVVYLEKLNPEQRRHSVRANDPRRADARVELIARRVIGDRAGVMTDALWAGTFHGIGMSR